jgi:tRNA pseudouridine 55 synthase
MTGILCIDKPVGFTSFDVVAKMRGILHMRKIGHAGTLDPMATGVLPLFLGGAAKAISLLPNQDKQYTATFRLGEESDTQDSTGTVLHRQPVTATESELLAALGQFRGEILQTPPMYSAVKVGGKRLYDLARRGLEVEREARPVTIYALNLVANPQPDTYQIDVRCSKGTYVRTLCHDIGRALGCGAVMTALRRTDSGGFLLADCITIEQAAQRMQQGRLRECLVPLQQVFAPLPRFELTEKQAGHLGNGVKMSLGQFAPPPVPGNIALYDQTGRFLGVGCCEPAAGILRAKKLFATWEDSNEIV